MKLKEEISGKKYNEMLNNALVCEVGFFIGTFENIDSYIKKNILLKCEDNIDAFIVFYMFCNYVVKIFNDSCYVDVYELIESDYEKLVSMFIEEYFVEEDK